MLKETIICILIILLIFTFDFITQKYTENKIEVIIKKLESLEDVIKENNIEKNQNKINDINKSWEKIEKTLSYFLEHDEIEKIGTGLKLLTSFINSGEVNLSLSEIEKTIFILKHIEEKNSFSLENIF